MWGRKKEEPKLELKDVVFLPADGNGLNLNLQPGEWTSFGSSQLRNVADRLPNIQVGFGDGGSSNQRDTNGIDEFSIPSPWAKYILFETALYNDGLDILHEKVKAEWRGLLAILALRELRGLHITFEEIVMQEGAGSFFDILLRTRPSNSIFDQDSAWDRVVVIKMDNEYTLGTLSNSTFVCPPYEYDLRTRITLERQISWFKGGKFVDPVECLDDEYASALIYWLQEVKSQLTRNMGSGSSLSGIMNMVVGLFDSYINDLKDRLSLLRKPLRSKDEFEFADLASACYSMPQLMRFHISQRDDGNFSDVALFANSNFIIVSRKMWDIETQSDAAQKIKIFGRTTLRDFPENFVSGSRMFGHRQIPEGLVIYKAEDLFLEDVYLIKLNSASSSIDDMDNYGGSAVRGGYDSVVDYRGCKYNVIWPLGDILLKYLTPTEIKNSISIRPLRDDQLEVRLKIKLTGPAFMKRTGSNFVEFEISRVYDNKESPPGENSRLSVGKVKFTDFTCHNLPNIAVWPFQTYSNGITAGTSENIWSKYYTFISTDYYSKLLVEPVYDSTSSEYTLNRIPEKFINCRIIHSTTLPRYVSCRFKDGDSTSSGREIGVLFLKQPAHVSLETSKTWKIGLDFGTTSTTAFYDDGNKKDFIRFGSVFEKSADGRTEVRDAVPNNIYFMTINPGDAAFFDPVYKYFMPLAYLNKRIYLSMYEKLRDPDTSEKNDYLKAFYDGHIFFHSNKVRFDASSESIFKDLKWGDETQTKIAREYLKQILLQCAHRAASEGAAKIDWRFSYPAALGENRKNIYIQSLEAAIASLQNETGLQMKISHVATESLAASLFFQNMEGSSKPLPNEAFVCIDIGGGSTDISVWKQDGNNSNKLQSSFRFASRNMFLHSLFKSGKVFQKLIMEPASIDKAASEMLNKNNTVSNFSPQIEYELVENEIRIENDRTNILGMDYYVDFVKLVSLGFLGVMYYIADIVANLLQKGVLSDIMSVKFYLSGNGAKLYKWVLTCVNQGTIEKEIAKLLEPYGIREVHLFFNERALKTEAAIGLLHVDNHNNDLGSEYLIAGEKFEIRNRDGSILACEATTDMLDKKTGILDSFIAHEIDIKPDKELTNLKRFVDMFNRIFEEKGKRSLITLDEMKLNSIYGTIQSKIAILKQDNRLDPIFILGIHSLLELMYNENEKKNNG